METEFTPILSLLGGGLIGASAVLLMATHGRIAGISGIISRILPPRSAGQSLSQGLVFVIGLLLSKLRPRGTAISVIFFVKCYDKSLIYYVK